MISLALFVISNVLVGLGAWARLTCRITRHQFSGIAATACLTGMAAAAVDGITTVASGFAALGTVNAWIWWHGGGGDGTRRRLKSWARRFQGVRRTAPVGA